MSDEGGGDGPLLAPDPVLDAELLYRRIPDKEEHFKKLGDGQLGLNSTAFNDRYRRPSVDRAGLCGNDPRHTQKEPSAGVVRLPAGEVRGIALDKQCLDKQGLDKQGLDKQGLGKQGKEAEHYRVDVLAAPLSDNAAQAVIATDPALDSDKVFSSTLTHSELPLQG
jgi:hypothetical protein